jgi:hypothetical protein
MLVVEQNIQIRLAPSLDLLCVQQEIMDMLGIMRSNFIEECSEMVRTVRESE